MGASEDEILTEICCPFRLRVGPLKLWEGGLLFTGSRITRPESDDIIQIRFLARRYEDFGCRLDFQAVIAESFEIALFSMSWGFLR